jgi:hypothetical protein
LDGSVISNNPSSYLFDVFDKGYGLVKSDENASYTKKPLTPMLKLFMQALIILMETKNY